MPRLKKNTSTVKRRIETADKYNLKNTFDFFDPFKQPLGFGTLPEKLVYAALTRMGIPFYYLNDISFSDPEIDFFKEYQADFIIPSVKVIIEVQGSYWHSKPAAIEADSYKLAVYESFGYKALAWWDFDIFDHLDMLISSEPLLLSVSHPDPQLGGKSMELTPMKRTKTDTSQGIRTLNARKFKGYKKFQGASRKTQRKVQSSYESRPTR